MMFFLFPSLSPSLRLETKTTGRHSCSIRVGLQFVAASSWPVIKANRRERERENERRAIAVELNAAVAAAVTGSLFVCLPADPSASSDAAAAAASVICVDLLSL